MFISCKRYTELLAKKIDNAPLSKWEKFCLYFHHVGCLFCRRYNRQVNLIDKLGKDACLNTSNTKSPSNVLPFEFKKNLKERLSQEDTQK